MCLITDFEECGVSPKMDLVSQRIIGECLDVHSNLNQKRLNLLHLLLLHFKIGYERAQVMERFTFVES